MDWFSMIVGGAGLVIAIIAIFQTRQANAVAARAMKMQEDQSLVRLVVEPRMLLVLGDSEDERPRPVVRVINLGAFPITIEKIWWKTASPDGKGFFWKNPPLRSLPSASRKARATAGLHRVGQSVDERGGRPVRHGRRRGHRVR